MPVNSGGDKSGKKAAPFEFLNKPSRQVAKKKAARVSKPQGALKQAMSNVVETTKTTAADPKAGTQTQRKAVRKSYDKLTPAKKQEAVSSAKVGTVKGDTILRTHNARVSKRRDAKATLDDTVHAVTSGGKKKDGGSRLSTILGSAPSAAFDAAPAVVNLATGSKIPLPSHLLHIAAAATKNVGQATVESPGQVAGSTGREAANTLRGVGAAGLGAVRATGDAVAHPSHIKKLPGAAVKFAKDTEKDYERRYGDALSDPKAFRERVKKEGALSYALDVAPGVGTAGRVGGEIAGAAARTGRLGKVAKAATEERPRLRVNGGEAVKQERSTNLFRAVAQDAKDNSRKKAVVKRTDEKGRVRGLIPQEGEVVRKTIRAQERDQRRIVSRVSARAGTRTKLAQHREVHGGRESSAAATKKLDKRESLGLKYAVQLGIRDPATAAKALAKHRADIVKARKVYEEKHGEPFHADFDELEVIDDILADPKTVFTAKLAEVAKGEAARGERTAAVHPSLKAEDATMRAHADQASHLGITREGTPIREARKQAARKLGEAKKALDEEVKGGGRTAIAKAMEDVKAAQKHAADLKAAKGRGDLHVDAEPKAATLARVRKAAADAGLEKPGYFPGRVFDEGGSSPYTGHNVGRAMAADKRYSGTSFSLGAQDSSAEALRLGLAKNLKRAHNSQGVADVVERSAPEWGRSLTASEAKQAIRKAKGDPESWALIDTKLMRKKLDDAEVDGDTAGADAGMADALDKAIVKNIRDLNGDAAEYKGSRFHVVPRAVADELQAGMTPTNSYLRGLSKFQGVQSKLLLNTNPTFVPVQVVSNTPLAVLALRGNVKDLVAGQRWYKGLDQQGRDVVDEFIGTSASGSFGASSRFGDSTGNALAKMWDSTLNSQKYREWQEGIRNPMNWNPLLDGKQNAFFRKAIFYNEAKRQAAKSMGKAGGAILDEAAPLMDALKMKPGPERDAALRAAEPQAEKIAARVDEMLGDFTRFTAKERKYLKTGVLFYGFMRWATRLAFYTLPVKHPIATSMVAKLGQLHNAEVVDLLSGYADEHHIGSKEDVAKLLREGAMPYVFGRVWTLKNGNLEYADATRLNPLMGPLVDGMERLSKQGIAAGPAVVTGMLSPALANTLDTSYGKSTFTGKDLKDAAGSPLSAGQNLDYVLGQQARSIFPIRVADKLLNPAPQSDESIPLVRVRKAQATSATKQAANAAKLKERGTDANVLLDEVLAMARTRRDGSMRGIAAELDKKSKAKSRKEGGKRIVKRPAGALAPLPPLPKVPPLPALPKLKNP